MTSRPCFRRYPTYISDLPAVPVGGRGTASAPGSAGLAGARKGRCLNGPHAACLPLPSGEGGLSRYLDGNPQVSDARAGRGVHARQAVQGAWRPRRRAQARDQPSAARRQDRHGLSRLRPADRRGHLRGQCRPDAGREALRAREGLPPRHLCHVVDQGLDPGIHPALVEPGEDGHHRQPEAAVLQPAQGEGPDPGARRGRSAPRPGQADRHQARRAPRRT